MDNQDNIQDELRSLDSGLPVTNSPSPFSVPEGYFDGLAASILAKAKAQTVSVADELQELSPLLAGISRQMPYTLPEGYFYDNLSALPFLVTEKESAVLAAIGKTNPYSVPEDYFDALPHQITAKLFRPKAKVVPFFSRTWIKVAAAVVGGVILLGGYFLLNQPISSNDPVAATYPSADSSENFVAKTESSVVQEIGTISTEEIDAFIQTVPLNLVRSRSASTELTGKEQFAEMLQGVSASEIDAFLEQIPTADENLTVID
jgi:hypothetical protein